MRIVIAEDLALLRDGLTRLLRDNGFEVVGAVSDGGALVTAVLLERPDVAIVDVRLPPTFTDEGLRAAIDARAQLPGLLSPTARNSVQPDRPSSAAASSMSDR